MSQAITLNVAVNAAQARWARQNTAASLIDELGGMSALNRGDLIRIARMLGGRPQVRDSVATLRRYIQWAMA